MPASERRQATLHTLVVFTVALAVRAAIVAWGHARFPPIADGEFYHRFATRLAEGLGYTVEWPDGVVTYAAHYPVGYPAILSAAYRVFGATPGVAMCVNAAIGTLAAACAHRVALRELSPRRALAAGLAVALHPALVLYTPAVMTEGVAAALVVVAMACAAPPNASRSAVFARTAAMGVVFGVATLVRPQTIVFAPILAFVFAPARLPTTTRLVASTVAVALALLTVAPWTIRNCERMNRCALVSVNGGWNLLIGVHTQTGSWTELETPPGCTTVFDEAEKDRCFEHAARSEIAASPAVWIAKAPRKLAVTFDIMAAGPWYLFHSNVRAFPERQTIVWGAIETLALRGLLVAAIASSSPLWRLRVRRKKLGTTTPRLALAAVAVVFALIRTAWPAYALLSLACLVRDSSERRSPLRMAAGLVTGLTMLTHATFFGAGRYGLLVVPLVTLAAFACVRPKALSASASSRSRRPADDRRFA